MKEDSCILVLNGSPKPKGVVSQLLKAMTESLPDSYTVDWVDVTKLSVKPCIGCMKCRSNSDGICVLPQDDGQVLGEKLRTCAGLIVGTPTYWGNMSAQLKLVFDRNVPALMGEKPGGNPLPKHKGKPAAIITACTTPWPFNWVFAESRGAVSAVHEVLRWSGFKTLGRVVQPGTKKSPGVSEKYFAKARAVGTRF